MENNTQQGKEHLPPFLRKVNLRDLGGENE